MNFAQRCEEEGITFVGPKLHHLDIFGDKIKAKAAAIEAGIASIPGTDGPIASVDDALEFAERFGYPIMIKAALGGGGRGMRVAHDEKSAREGYERAKAKQKLPLVAMKCMLKNTSPILSISKYRFLVTHMETSSIFSKETVLFSVATKSSRSSALCLYERTATSKICQAAVQLMKHVGYVNAGTVEFLVEGDDFYFIEVNPRVQVEHTITEMITDIDIVTTQLLIAQGLDLHKEIGLPQQEEIKLNGSAIQCRITTEDPLNNFYQTQEKSIRIVHLADLAYVWM